MKIFGKKIYKVVEICGKHGLKIVKHYANYLDAIQALKTIYEKYAKNIRYYRKFSFTASISKNRSMLELVRA